MEIPALCSCNSVGVFRFRLGHEGLGAEVSAMAGAAGDRRAGAVDFGDGVGVDVFDHLVHFASGLLFVLGVVGEVDLRPAVRAELF